ncbi:hypothetical protein FRC00_004207, partial [Tulasnella sp. 408]
MTSTLTNRKPARSRATSSTPSSDEEEVVKFYVPNLTIKDLYSAIPYALPDILCILTSAS